MVEIKEDSRLNITRKRALFCIAVMLGGCILITNLALKVIFGAEKVKERDINMLEDGSEIIVCEVESVDMKYTMNSQSSFEDISEPKSQMQYFWPKNWAKMRWNRYDNVEDNIIITGYAYIPGVSIAVPNVSYILQDEATGEYIKIHTEVQKREDITEKYSLDSIDYNLSGIKGSVWKKELEKGHCYQICLMYKSDESNYFVRTDERIEGI